jgi:hypothetical protein
VTQLFELGFSLRVDMTRDWLDYASSFVALLGFAVTYMYLRATKHLVNQARLQTEVAVHAYRDLQFQRIEVWQNFVADDWQEGCGYMIEWELHAPTDSIREIRLLPDSGGVSYLSSSLQTQLLQDFTVQVQARIVPQIRTANQTFQIGFDVSDLGGLVTDQIRREVQVASGRFDLRGPTGRRSEKVTRIYKIGVTEV